MKRILLPLCFCLTGTAYAQTEVVFHYDEAGNQVYRGPFSSEDKTKNNAKEEPENSPQLSLMSAEEAAFWKEVKMAPVPVKDILTIIVSEEIRKNLQEISVYNMLGNMLYTKKRASDSSRTEISMGHYIEGAYVVKFILKGGKIYSQTILKHY
jgi:hypothetical protein